jgi:hypothetical protein
MADRITDALRGMPPVGQTTQGMTAQPDPEPQQDGTQASGYATPDLGPFECENCVKFQPPNQCGDPRVQADPEVQGQVDPEGCCNFFQSAHNETQRQEHGEQEENPEAEEQ